MSHRHQAAESPKTFAPDAVERLVTRLRCLLEDTPANDVEIQESEVAATTEDRLSETRKYPENLGAGSDSKESDASITLGPYRLLKIIGSGGMGKVYLAEDRTLQRQVAVKVISPRDGDDPKWRERLLREARTAAGIEHDNVVAVYQVGEDSGLPYVAMPLLKGETLESLLRRDGVLPFEKTLSIATQIAAGLQAAHEKKIVHRDIKPGNIWIETSGRAKILDFGLALGADAHVTQTGVIVGTPAYMSPEQARGEKLGPAADLYSLGCILYRMTTGQLPHKGNDALTTFMSLANNEPAAPSDRNPRIPAALSKLILQMLSKNALLRPQTAVTCGVMLEKIQRELRAATDNTTVIQSRVATADPTGTETSKETRKGKPGSRVWIFAGAATFAIALIAHFAGVIYRFTFESKEGTVVVEAYENSGAKAKNTKELTITNNSELTLKVRVERPVDIKPKFENPAVTPSPVDATANLQNPSYTFHQPTKEDCSFVVFHSESKTTEEFQTVTAAIDSLGADDTVEVHGDGPYALGFARLQGKALRIRAAPGYRPSFIVKKPADPFTRAGIVIRNGAVLLEGCDFRSNQVSLIEAFEQSPMEFRNCRLFGGNVHLFFADGAITRLEDCLISGFSPYGNEGITNDTIECVNCIFHSSGYQLFSQPQSPNAKSTVKLDHCTIFFNGSLTSHVCHKDKGSYRIEADNSIFQLSLGIAWHRERRKANGGWRGRNNVYGGQNTLLSIDALKPNVHLFGLDTWRQYWGDSEQGSQEFRDLFFGWDLLSQPDGKIASAIPAFQSMVASLKRPNLGPQWEKLGTGKAFERAAADSGKPIVTEKRGQPVEARGAIVLLREEKEVADYTSLNEAFQFAQNDDIIEIRTNDPVKSCPITGEITRRLTLRAGAGFQPIIQGHLLFNSKNQHLILEGIHFREGFVGCDWNYQPNVVAPNNGILRIANCTFSSEYSLVQFQGRTPTTGMRTEVISNCEFVRSVLPGLLDLRINGGNKLVLRDSVLGPICLNHVAPGNGPSIVEIDRCCLWNPAGERFQFDIRAVQPKTKDLRVAISAKNTLFEPGYQFLFFTENVELVDWKGENNVFRAGARPWRDPWGCPPEKRPDGLADWQRLWKSDQNSIESDPLEYDPRQWRLVGVSPRQGDFVALTKHGADVDRIGRKAPLPLAPRNPAQQIQKME